MKRRLTNNTLKKLNNKKWLKNRYLIDDKTSIEIAIELGVSTTTTCKYLKKFDLIKTNYLQKQNIIIKRIGKSNYNKLNNKKWLKYKYITLDKSTEEIAEYLGVGLSIVSNNLRKFGFLKSRVLDKQIHKKLNSKSILNKLYVVEKKTTIEVSKILNVSMTTVTNKLKEFKLLRRKGKVISSKVLKKLNNKKWLKKQYINNKLSMKEIADILGCSGSTVRDHLIMFNIKIRIKMGSTINTPTRPEKVIRKLLTEIDPYGWRYTGNSNKLIGTLLPDFISTKGTNKIIEVFGNYWHGETMTGMTNKEAEKDKIKKYKKLNYRCIVLWEYDINNNINKVVNKITNFCCL